MKRQWRYTWLFGFLGFFGFTYFTTRQPLSLFWFSFFGFFAYYFIYQLSLEMPDERYWENSKNAKIKTAIIPLMAVFGVGLSAGFSLVSREFIILICAFSYALTLVSYAVLFWYYDTHG